MLLLHLLLLLLLCILLILLVVTLPSFSRCNLLGALTALAFLPSGCPHLTGSCMQQQ